MACTCIDLTDRALAEHNTRLGLALSLRGEPPKAVISTEIIVKKRGARPVNLIATYCPFCGVAYGDAGPTEKETAPPLVQESYWIPSPDRTCPKCRHRGAVSYYISESSDHGDGHAKCGDCGYRWGLDGPDS